MRLDARNAKAPLANNNHPWVCHCGKSFSQHSALKAHIQNVCGKLALSRDQSNDKSFVGAVNVLKRFRAAQRSYAESKTIRAQRQTIVDKLKSALPLKRDTSRKCRDAESNYSEARSDLRAVDTRMKSLSNQLSEVRKEARAIVLAFLDGHGEGANIV